MFSIDANDGTIRTRTILEHMSQENYTLSVVVRDRGSPSRQSSYNYIVKVLLETDISLPFSKTNLVFTVPESMIIGGVVGSVQPHDPHYDLTQVWYSIDQGNEAGLFDIENQSGDIIVTGQLDADTFSEHNIRVSLNDNVYGMARQTIRVRIIVTDVNDNPPSFSASPLQVTVSEAADLSSPVSVSYTHLRARETSLHLVCRLLIEKK